MSSSSSPGVLSVRFDKENVDPQQQSATDSSSASSEPAKPEHSAALVAGITIPTSSSTSTSPTAELAANKKKRKKSASAPRTLTKEELAEYIARGEFWQKSEAAEGEGDGYQYGRGDEQSTDDPIYEDCNEVRRKITAFLKTGRMTQTAWCKLLGVNASSLQRFMKAKVSKTYRQTTRCTAAATHSSNLCLIVCITPGPFQRQCQRRVPCCRSLLREPAHTGAQAEVSEAEEGGGSVREVRSRLMGSDG